MARKRVSYDALIKLMMSRAPEALAAWILGKTPSRVEELDPTIPVATAGYLDKLLSVELPDEDPLMLHVEVQTAGYPRMGTRMFAYSAFLVKKMVVPTFARHRIHPVVVYLDRASARRDPGVFRLPLRDGREVPLPYSVRRLWEEDPGPILGCGSPWLLPFVPLMRGSDPCRAVVECAKRIRAARIEPDDRRDILVCLAGLAGLVVEDYHLIAEAVWEEPMRESSWIRHWVDTGVAEGLQQGIEKGIEKGRVEAAGVVLDVLSERFGAVPADVEEKVRAERSFDRLHELARLALRARSIEEFAARV